MAHWNKPDSLWCCLFKRVLGKGTEGCSVQVAASVIVWCSAEPFVTAVCCLWWGWYCPVHRVEKEGLTPSGVACRFLSSSASVTFVMDAPEALVPLLVRYEGSGF